MTDRPLPAASDLTRPFWEAAASHVLVRPFCDGCARSFFPPQVCCPACLSEDWRWEASAGRGTVYSHTTISRAPFPGFDVPYVLAVVDLEDGFSLLTNVVGAEPAVVGIGMRVRVDWERTAGWTFPVFVPDPRQGEGEQT